MDNPSEAVGQDAWLRIFCAAVSGLPCRYDTDFGFRYDESLAEFVTKEAALIADLGVRIFRERYGDRA